MTTAAAFRAEFSDWKLVKTRKVVQLVFEVPVEQSGLAYDVLGGMPDPGKSVWCAIARLQEGGEATQTEQQLSTNQKQTEPEANEYPAQSLREWSKIALPQQAGILCADPVFQKFLGEKIAPDADFNSCSSQAAADLAANIVRHHCIVQSRSDIKENHPSGRLWRGLVMDYRAWMREPEYAQ